jgi:hypothetical protein
VIKNKRWEDVKVNKVDDMPGQANQLQNELKRPHRHANTYGASIAGSYTKTNT